MGLMDKVKAQATQLAQKTQETAREGRARLDQVQANKRADVLLRNLGALVFAEQTGRGTAESQSQIAALIVEISAHEAENGINLSAQQPGWIPPQSGPGGGMGGSGGMGAPGGMGTPGGSAGPGSTPFADPGASSFPQSGPTFPPPGDPTAFPDPGGPTTFPPSGDPTAFPDPGAGSPFPDSGESTKFPDSGDPTAFPPEPGSTPSS